VGQPSDPWDEATWEGARMATLLKGARMSLPERLAWIEEITEVASHLRGSATRHPAEVGGSEGGGTTDPTDDLGPDLKRPFGS
jgi:hypothetical protein